MSDIKVSDSFYARYELAKASPSRLAILECLQLCAPGVKWNAALAGNFERMLEKRKFRVISTEYEFQHGPNCPCTNCT